MSNVHLPLLSVVLAVALVGCGDRTRLNPGAELSVYVGSTQHMWERIPTGVNRAAGIVEGYYDPADRSITINEQMHGWRLARCVVHELGHAFDHQKPSDLWELMARYESPEFSFNPHLADLDPAAVNRALDAARQAEQEAKQ